MIFDPCVKQKDNIINQRNKENKRKNCLFLLKFFEFRKINFLGKTMQKSNVSKALYLFKNFPASSLNSLCSFLKKKPWITIHLKHEQNFEEGSFKYFGFAIVVDQFEKKIVELNYSDLFWSRKRILLKWESYFF